MTLTEAKKFLEKNGYLVETDNRPGFYDYPLIMAITYKGHTIYCGAEDGDMWSDDKEDAYIWKNYDLISTIAVDNFIAVAKEVFETKYIDEDRVEYIPAKENITNESMEEENGYYAELCDLTNELGFEVIFDEREPEADQWIIYKDGNTEKAIFDLGLNYNKLCNRLTAFGYKYTIDPDDDKALVVWRAANVNADFED